MAIAWTLALPGLITAAGAVDIAATAAPSGTALEPATIGYLRAARPFANSWSDVEKLMPAPSNG